MASALPGLDSTAGREGRSGEGMSVSFRIRPRALSERAGCGLGAEVPGALRCAENNSVSAGLPQTQGVGLHTALDRHTVVTRRRQA